MCNAYNHPPGCNCGWGGGWHGGGYANSYATHPSITPTPTPKTYRSEFKNDDYCSPSKCPICGESVYFVRHNGGSVWLDSLGHPWPKHACFDDDNYSINLLQILNNSDSTIFGVVIEVEATHPGINGRIVVKCSDGTTINSIFNYADDIKFWLGKLVIINKKDENTSITTIGEELMQNFNVDLIFERLKEEMVSAWAYLDALKQIYENEDNKHIDTLLETAPGFFSLVESSLMESAFSRLVRLLDPKQSCGEDNLSFAKLCEHCKSQYEFKKICEEVSKIMLDWKNGKYNNLRTYRNKFHSHNDLSRLGNAQPLISTRMSREEFGLVKELFEDLWRVIKHLNSLIKDSALFDPTYANLNLRPVSFLPYLETGLKISKLLPDHPELYGFINNDG